MFSASIQWNKEKLSRGRDLVLPFLLWELIAVCISCSSFPFMKIWTDEASVYLWKKFSSEECLHWQISVPKFLCSSTSLSILTFPALLEHSLLGIACRSLGICCHSVQCDIYKPKDSLNLRQESGALLLGFHGYLPASIHSFYVHLELDLQKYFILFQVLGDLHSKAAGVTSIFKIHISSCFSASSNFF